MWRVNLPMVSVTAPCEGSNHPWPGLRLPVKGQITPSQGYSSLGRVTPPFAGLQLKSRKKMQIESKEDLEGKKKKKKKDVKTASISMWGSTYPWSALQLPVKGQITPGQGYGFLWRVKSPLVKVTAPWVGSHLPWQGQKAEEQQKKNANQDLKEDLEGKKKKKKKDVKTASISMWRVNLPLVSITAPCEGSNHPWSGSQLPVKGQITHSQGYSSLWSVKSPLVRVTASCEGSNHL